MRILGVVSSSSREVPNAPTIGTATDVGTGRAYNNGAATVTFTAPTWTGGLPITGYTVTSSPGGFTATGAASPLTVAGLASSTAYTFTAVATNSRGNSTASAASNSITATTVPQAPTIGTATDGGTGSTVSVAFTAGATGGKTVTTYTATSSPGGLTGTAASSPITVSGLTAGTAYTFTVTATNANGTSTASSASNSVTPATPTSYESIATISGTGSSGTITFTSIPSTYKHLQIRYIAKVTGTGGSDFPLDLRFNSDTGTNYPHHRVYGDGSSAYADGAAATTRIVMTSMIPDSFSSWADMFAIGVIDIIDYQSTTKNKTVKAMLGVNRNSTQASDQQIVLKSGLWLSTSAVTSISLISTSNWTTTTQFALYGIKG